VARRDLSETFIPDMKDGMVKGRGRRGNDPRLDSFLDRVTYFQTNFDDDDGFERLKHYLQELDEELGTRGNRCSTWRWHRVFADIIARLGAHAWHSREKSEQLGPVVIEKPFGTGSRIGQEINDDVNAVLFRRIR